MLTLFIVYALLLLLWSLRPQPAAEPCGEEVAERSLSAALTPPDGAIRVARRAPALRA